MRRREFIAFAGGATMWPLAASLPIARNSRIASVSRTRIVGSVASASSSISTASNIASSFSNRLINRRCCRQAAAILILTFSFSPTPREKERRSQHCANTNSAAELIYTAPREALTLCSTVAERTGIKTRISTGKLRRASLGIIGSRRN
jgi:hypothetical protein